MCLPGEPFERGGVVLHLRGDTRAAVDVTLPVINNPQNASPV
jgi:hypothetical protein